MGIYVHSPLQKKAPVVTGAPVFLFLSLRRHYPDQVVWV
jgi:hypothetical protein